MKALTPWSPLAKLHAMNAKIALVSHARIMKTRSFELNGFRCRSAFGKSFTCIFMHAVELLNALESS